MPVKVYHYPNCSTCRKALKWLEARGVEHTAVDIAATPPSRRELKQMLSHYDGDLRRVFNTSGQAYRKQNIRDRFHIPSLKLHTDAQGIATTVVHYKGEQLSGPLTIGAIVRTPEGLIAKMQKSKDLALGNAHGNAIDGLAVADVLG